MKLKILPTNVFIRTSYSPIWLLLVFVFITSISKADIPVNDLFIEAEASSETLGSVNPAIVLRQRGVTIAQDALTQQSELIFINLFENVFLTAELDHIENAGNGNWAWIGKVQGESDSEVTFVVNHGKVSGTIMLSDIGYHIRPLQSGLHVIREIDLATLQDTLEAASSTSGSEPQVLENAQFEGEPVFLQTFQLNAQPFLPEEQEVFQLLNQERAVQGLHLLSSDPALITAARAHSQDMSQNNYFSHTNLQGKSAGQRMLEAGYSWNAWGENIAAGYTTPTAVMNAWMNSPGHRANILNSTFCDVGVGYESQGRYWTQDFGRKQGVFSCPEPQTPTNPPADPVNPNPPANPVNPNPPSPPGTPTPQPTPDTGNGLANGQAKAFSAAQNQTVAFVIQVPANAVNLKVTMSGSGDADLYVKRTPIQWPNDFGPHNEAEFKAPFNYGSNESVVFAAPAAGTWHVLIHGYSASQGNIVATWDIANDNGDSGNNTPPPGSNQLTNGAPVSVNLTRNQVKEFSLNLPAGARNLVVTMTGTGDADLYVKRSAIQWPQDFGPHNSPEFKSLWAFGSNETLRFQSPAPGTWHILLHGYTAANVTIKASWQ